MKSTMIAILRVLAGLCIEVLGLYLLLLLLLPEFEGASFVWAPLLLALLALPGYAAGWVAGKVLLVPGLLLYWGLCMTFLDPYDWSLWVLGNDGAGDARDDLRALVALLWSSAALAIGIVAGARHRRRWADKAAAVG